MSDHQKLVATRVATELRPIATVEFEQCLHGVDLGKCLKCSCDLTGGEHSVVHGHTYQWCSDCGAEWDQDGLPTVLTQKELIAGELAARMRESLPDKFLGRKIPTAQEAKEAEKQAREMMAKVALTDLRSECLDRGHKEHDWLPASGGAFICRWCGQLR